MKREEKRIHNPIIIKVLAMQKSMQLKILAPIAKTVTENITYLARMYNKLQQKNGNLFLTLNHYKTDKCKYSTDNSKYNKEKNRC